MCERAWTQARVAVLQYGRAGTLEDKRRASAVVRKRISLARSTKRKGLAFGLSGLSHRLKQLRKDSADPGLPGGPLTPDERAPLETVNEPVAREDVEKAEALAHEALRSKDVQKRFSAVEKLVGLGEAGLLPMIAFLDDQDARVSDLAASRAEEGICEIDDAREVAAMTRYFMLKATNPEKLQGASQNLVMCADQKVAVLAVIDVIEFGTPVQAEVAKETFANITGDEWVGKQAAEAWIRENCEQEDEEELSTAEAAKAFAKRKLDKVKHKKGKGNANK